jgi:hypothetical protein
VLYRLIALVLLVAALLGAWSYHRGLSLPEIVRNELQPSGKVAVLPKKIVLPAANPTDLPMTPTPIAVPWPPIRMLISRSDAELGMVAAHSLLDARHVELRITVTDSRLMMQAQLQNMAENMSLGPRAFHNPWSCDMALLSCHDPAVFLRDLNTGLKSKGSTARAVAIATLRSSRNRRRLFAPSSRVASGQGVVATREAIQSAEFRDWLRSHSFDINLDPSSYNPTMLNWVPATSDDQAALECGAAEAKPRRATTGGAAPILIPTDVITDLSFYDLPTDRHRAGTYPVANLGPGPEQPCVLIGIDRWMAPQRSLIHTLVQTLFEGNREVLQTPASRSNLSLALMVIYASSHADKGLTEVGLDPATLYPRAKASDCSLAVGGDAALIDTSYLK